MPTRCRAWPPRHVTRQSSAPRPRHAHATPRQATPTPSLTCRYRLITLLNKQVRGGLCVYSLSPLISPVRLVGTSVLREPQPRDPAVQNGNVENSSVTPVNHIRHVELTALLPANSTELRFCIDVCFGSFQPNFGFTPLLLFCFDSTERREEKYP